MSEVHKQKQNPLAEKNGVHAQHAAAAAQPQANAVPAAPADARMEACKEGFKDFSDEFEREWDVKDAGVSYAQGMIEAKFSISEIGKLVSGKKRSGAAIELKNCILEMKKLTANNGNAASAFEQTEKLFELSMAANMYYDSHKSAYKWTYGGTGRLAIAKKVKKLTKKALLKLLTDEEKKRISSNANVDFRVGESMGTITKDLKAAAKAFRRFMQKIGQDSCAYTAGELLERRMQVLRLYERKIKLYREAHKDPETRDSDIRELIRAYEEGLGFEALRSATKMDQKQASLHDMIERHVEEEGEIAHREKIKAEDSQEGLSEGQLRGINEIDNWLIRNCKNGGVAGIFGIKNQHADFVSAVLSLSKRERLHMYYLVETGKRKTPGILDVGMSQSVYIPTLSGFKDQMVATKWKWWARIDGDYTYMYKLSEAFQITREYRDELRGLTELEKHSAEKQKGNAIPSAAEERLQKLQEFKNKLETYLATLRQAIKEKGKKKAMEDLQCIEQARECTEQLKELVKLDVAVEKAEIENAEGADALEEVGAAIENAGKVVSKPATAQEITNLASKYVFHSTWHLKSAGWQKLNLWGGSSSTTVDGVSSLLGMVTGILGLVGSGGLMSKEELSSRVLEVVQSGSDTVKSVFDVKDLVQTAGSLTADGSAASQMLGYGSVAISAGIAVAKSVAAGKMKYHGKKAGSYFEEKRRQAELSGALSKEEKRELKYEKCMMKLQNDLLKRNAKNAAYSWVDTGLATASLFIPGMGFVKAGFSMVAKILDNCEVTGIRTRLFDNFFNMDELTAKAMASKDAQRLLKLDEPDSVDSHKFRAALRKRVAACAGFCDVHAAAGQICMKFARLVREKLFDAATPEAERNGYKEFVMSLNLKYDKDKKYPTENTLTKKLSAQ